jgi:hypothetical protein
MRLPNWIRTKKKNKLDIRRKELVDQVKMCEEFYRFAHMAHKKGFETDLLIRVDGQTCRIGVRMREGNSRALLEYLCNFAAVEKMYALERLEEFDEAKSDSYVRAFPWASGSAKETQFPTGSRGDGSQDEKADPQNDMGF